jgi:hypothetical protein
MAAIDWIPAGQAFAFDNLVFWQGKGGRRSTPSRRASTPLFSALIPARGSRRSCNLSSIPH